MKRNALGKGLSALLPDPEPESPPSASDAPAGDVPTAALTPNPFQPRSAFDEAGLGELAASIQETGMVQPILVRPLGADRYQIIAGERRWRAAQRLGLPRVPVTIREVPDDRLLEMALVENIQRRELSPFEEALAYQRLQDEFSMTQEQVAQRVGKERSTVANTLRLLRLSDEIRSLISAGRLDAGHGRALLPIERRDDQLSLAQEAARKGWSVRELERRVAEMKSRPAKPAEAGRKDANTRAAEERLRAALGTRVAITRRGRGGALRIEFSSEAELQRLYDWLTHSNRPRG